jgi:hypothetical protein
MRESSEEVTDDSFLPRLSNSFYTQIGKWWGGVQEAMEGA